MLEWDDFTQEIGEIVRAYTNRFCTLLLKVRTIEIKTEEEQARKYLSGLYGSMHSEVKCFNPKTLTETIPLAKRIEEKY